MNFRVFFLSLVTVLATLPVLVNAQADSVIGQFTSSTQESFAGGVSGDGRLVVFESRGNIATENPRNSDFSNEIFIFDYAQRRIFQITDTKSVLIDRAAAPIATNIRVDITNKRPVISNNGRWIAFGSNATTSTVAVPNSTNPGSFDGNSFTGTDGANPLTLDGNMEMWLYEIPAVAPADLTTGEELPPTDLSIGTFIRVTNTSASRLPRAATSTSPATVAEDNHDASITDDGGIVAFVSTRNLVPDLPAGNADVNDEIFTYVRATSTTAQITKTPRGEIGNPIYNKNPTIAGNGSRIVFSSRGENPILGMTGGNNPAASRNEEIHYADLVGGATTATTVKRQITVTTPLNVGDPVNLLDLGRRMSRDGSYIAFDSYADLEAPSSPVQTSFALYLYDVTTNTFDQIGPRSTADAAATGGDVAHYPGFTDNDVNGRPAKLVLETRQNIKADGTVPATSSEGLNDDPTRPTQIYSLPIVPPNGAQTFTRLTKLPISNTFLASTQPLPSDSSRRIVFNLGLTELGTGNADLLSEAYYLYVPPVLSEPPPMAPAFDLFTGASAMRVSASPVPTPTPSPTPTGTPAPTPTPQTPSAVHGLSPGMLAIASIIPRTSQPLVARTAVGSLQRSFQLPIELSGVTMTINGAACGLKSVQRTATRYEILFVTPPALASVVTGTTYKMVVNNNGEVYRQDVAIVPARPDIFSKLPQPGPGGRAQAVNATNRVLQPEPFTVHTIRIRGGIRVATVLRLRLTGVANTTAAVFTIRIGSVSITGTRVLTGGVLVEPGVYTVDFTLPPELRGTGDQPIIVSINVNGTIFSSRLDDTAPRVFIL